jgi:DNA repair exonuclease SbcCD nuclease subunit
MMRFIHTADWQIGKVFRRFGEKEPVLQQARLDAIGAIGALARSEGIGDVLVAGDIYDHEAPLPRTLREPLERMRQHPSVRWHLIPGNHDPHRPRGLWDRVQELGLPGNVVAHLTPQPFRLEGAVLLPAPLMRKSEVRDLTAWMDAAESPPGTLRIGLAHGSVTDFGTEGEAGNPIDPARPSLAGLDYLALGDWHRTVEIGPRLHYAGTPEPDRFDSQPEGVALIVSIDGPGATPQVERRVLGRHRWLRQSRRLDDPGAIADLERQIRAMPGLSSMVMRLDLEGALPLEAHAALQDSIDGLQAAMFWLDVDRAGLSAKPSLADLEAIDFDGVLRRSTDHLLALAQDGSLDADARRLAEEALVELYTRSAGRGAREAAP